MNKIYIYVSKLVNFFIIIIKNNFSRHNFLFFNLSNNTEKIKNNNCCNTEKEIDRDKVCSTLCTLELPPQSIWYKIYFVKESTCLKTQGGGKGRQIVLHLIIVENI